MAVQQGVSKREARLVPPWLAGAAGTPASVEIYIRDVSGDGSRQWRAVNPVPLLEAGLEGAGATARVAVHPLRPSASFEAKARLVSPVAGKSQWSQIARRIQTDASLPPPPVVLWDRLPASSTGVVLEDGLPLVTSTTVGLRWTAP